MKEKKSKETRTRTWTFIIYPDSAPDNWRDILDDMHVEWIESPLHDSDLNATNEVKKTHWHILLIFSGVKAYEQVIELLEPLNCPSPQRCHNARALVRYMAHLDNPEKHQYKIEDIKAHGGVDLAEMLRPSSSERYTLIKEMFSFIKDNGIIEYQDLMDYAAEFRFDDWFPALCDNSSIVLVNYIKSCRHRSSYSIDFSTGEKK